MTSGLRRSVDSSGTRHPRFKIESFNPWPTGQAVLRPGLSATGETLQCPRNLSGATHSGFWCCLVMQHRSGVLLIRSVELRDMTIHGIQRETLPLAAEIDK